jgi:macrolide transport system ATP-binding/permease protein
MLELKNINKIYKTGKIPFHALKDINLSIEQGEFVAIMGPSGSGKSTLLHILGCLHRPDSGSYTIYEKEVNELNDNELAILRNNFFGFIFQQFHLLPNITVIENVGLPLIYTGKRKVKEKVKEKIKEVGLLEKAFNKLNELSGGEQQKIAIARALVNEPMVILADEPTGNLDTKSQEEIMKIIEELNKQGKTIVMVTHEEDVAKHARRIIKMRDGRIIYDEKISSYSKSSDISMNNILSRNLNGGSAKFIDYIKEAFQSIVSHKMRSILSVLGILIGIASVIAMLALGEGAKESISQSLASLGTNLLTVRPGSSQLRGIALEAGSVTRFTLQDAEVMGKLLEIRRVSPLVRGRAQVVFGNKNWNTQIQGTGVDYAEMRASIPTIGRFFTEEEIRARQKVAVIGVTIVKQLFGEINPIGTTIKINKINFQVIGILPEKGSGPFGDQDDTIIIPITTAMYRVLGKEYVDSIDVEVKDAKLIDKAQNSLSELIIKRHHLISEKEKDSFQIRNMADIKNVMETTTKTITTLLGTIAAISLLVGGIGIMNIMLVSVKERTKEIGLRKAIGAKAKDIMTQFLIESIVMTFIGGIAGILFGVCSALSISSFLGWATKVSLFSIIIATTFSIAVGLVFGLWPARQAAKLDPIDALRYE